MADPDLDFGIVYDEHGFVHILHSTFFDVNPEIDNNVKEYVERILFTLSEAIEEQLGSVQWWITSKPLQSIMEPFEDVIYPKGDPDAVSISKRDIELLEPDTFINDTIIDFYIK
ncbi:hypothetical protein IEQ34_021333 [Dendrobium chrysotoxum]|uniref:Uncharacterized protein n=1 Tax=Dendrobium chrysotoxum TaxID=161865 RepID=A0AAV7G2T4_DENCH|nr:hypothetical protein IEQ34_021333 [Dendrobium chrysotoxum]